jgi:hypothetical protein
VRTWTRLSDLRRKESENENGTIEGENTPSLLRWLNRYRSIVILLDQSSSARVLVIHVRDVVEIGHLLSSERGVGKSGSNALDSASRSRRVVSVGDVADDGNGGSRVRICEKKGRFELSKKRRKAGKRTNRWHWCEWRPSRLLPQLQPHPSRARLQTT